VVPQYLRFGGARYEYVTLVNDRFSIYVNAQTRELTLPRYCTRSQNMRDRFLILQLFNSAGVCEFAIICKVVTRF